MACITYGTNKLDTEASFRVPFGIFFVVPVIISVGAWFMHEVCLFLPLLGVVFSLHLHCNQLKTCRAISHRAGF
jgi:hypothetical protein